MAIISLLYGHKSKKPMPGTLHHCQNFGRELPLPESTPDRFSIQYLTATDKLTNKTFFAFHFDLLKNYISENWDSD